MSYVAASLRIVMTLQISAGIGLLPAGADACDFFASPGGGGDGSRQASPFTVNDFWRVAAPGSTLCLVDGTYTGSASMVSPPSGLKGQANNPITVRALNDGKATLDGSFSDYPIYFRNNDYFVIEGLNAHSGPGAVVLFYQSSRNTLRRIVAWDAHHPDPGQWAGTGQGNSAVFRIGFDSLYNLLEDCAGFGLARKVLTNSQGGDYVTIRRCWFRWDGCLANGPKMALTYSYNSRHATVENVIATFDASLMPQTYIVRDYDGGIYDGGHEMTNYQVWNPFGALASDIIDDVDKRAFARILGSLFYLRPGAKAYPWAAVYTNRFDGVELRDVVAYAAGTSIKPFSLGTLDSGGATELTLANATAIGSSASEIHSDWTVSNLLTAGTLGEAFSAGENVFNSARGANLCHRYLDGVRTTQPLWPWPMNQRIVAAMTQAGRQPVDVTASVEQMLGTIPPQCRSTSSGDSRLSAPTNLRLQR